MNPAQQVLARAADWGRAPSAHNTQPWQVTAAGPQTLRLGWHTDRVLEVGDPTRRDLMLSLGCVTEAITIVAAELGCAVRPSWRVDRDARLAGELALLPGEARARDDASFTVADLHARSTHRGPYPGPAVTAQEVARLVTVAGLGPGVQLTVLPPQFVQDQLRVADQWTFDGPATGELRDWLRLDPGDPRSAQDGLSEAAMGLARWESLGLRWALQPVALRVLRATRLTRVLARSATARPLGTVVALTAALGASDESLLDLGQQLFRVWLAARGSGVSAHPLSQLLDCPASAAQVRRTLGPERTAYAVFRLGRPAVVPAHSARLTD